MELGDQSVGRTVVLNVHAHLQLADAYRVTEDMCAMLLYAAAKLDTSDRFDKDMAPTPWGFVRFEKGLPIQEARGRQMLAHWLTWGPVTRQVTNAFGQTSEVPGILLSWWNDTRIPDQVQHELMSQVDGKAYAAKSQEVGHFGFVGCDIVRHGSSLGRNITPLTDEDRGILLSEGVLEPSDMTNTLRYAYALWFLLNQTIVETAEEHVPRAAAKMVGRMKIPGRVSVIQLRRKSHRRSEGETHVEWAHRWLVRGHPAWRKCGPDHPLAQPHEGGYRARVWISPYMKNAERTDLPIIQTQKVYNLNR
jgi:hypothetical protein